MCAKIAGIRVAAECIMLKKLLIGLGVLVVLLAIALVALVTLVDVNRYKPQIAQLVQDRYQRQLVIDGDLAFTVFPRLGVALPRSTLSESGSTAPFARLDAARVSVALLPLLGGRIEADRLRIDGLEATIERRADGSTSIDDLLGVRDRDAAPAAPPRSTADAAPQFAIGGIELRRAALSYRDRASGNTVALTQLDLETGPLGTQSRSKVELSTHFSATQPAAQGELRIRATLDLDLPRQAYRAQDLDLVLDAQLDRRALAVNGKAAELRFNGSGALAATRLALSGKGAIGDLALTEARVELPALAWDPSQQRLAVEGLKAQARGRAGAGAEAADFDAELAAPRLAFDRSSASGERVSLVVRRNGTQPLTASVQLEGLGGSAGQLTAARFALEAELMQTPAPGRARKLVAALAGPLTASIDAQTLALPQLAGALTIDDPALSQTAIRLPLNGALAADAKRQTAALQLRSNLDGGALAAQLDVRSFSPLRLAFDASADRLDLDRYFPPAKAAAGKGGAKEEEADAPVDLSALKDLDLSGALRIGQLQARGLRAQNLRIGLKAAGGRLDLAPVSAALYGGSLSAQAQARADDNRLALQAALTGVDLGPLLKDLLDRDLLDGRGSVKLDLATGGGSVQALKRGLGGSASVALRDGAIKGINLAQTLRNARSFLSSGGQTETRSGNASEKTDFSSLTASFAVKDGVARNSDLDLRSPLLRIGGAGQADVAAGTLDYTLRASVVGTLKGQDGRELGELRGVTLPVRLSGPFDAPSYTIDWRSAAGDALKSRATEQLKEKLQPKVQDKAKDLLKGLLKR